MYITHTHTLLVPHVLSLLGNEPCFDDLGGGTFCQPWASRIDIAALEVELGQGSLGNTR